MKKQILEIGRTLNRGELKSVFGGGLCEIPGVMCYYGKSCRKESDCIDPTIEYNADDLEGYGCKNGVCGY